MLRTTTWQLEAEKKDLEEKLIEAEEAKAVKCPTQEDRDESFWQR